MTLEQATADPQAFLAGLADGAIRALSAPVAASVLTVERNRSLADRLAGKPGSIREIRLGANSETLTLTHLAGPRFLAQAQKVSGGVVISRRTLTLGEWLSVFAGRIAAVAGDAAGEASAAAHALHTLGIESTGSDVRVADATLDVDLRSLPARVESRLPPEAVTAVRRITGLLLETLPRLAGNLEAEMTARRTATSYLPETLRTYLALPAEWAHNHVFADGTTPDTALAAQLTVLETAVTEMYDAAVRDDAEGLLINGRFLSARFARSSLDLS
ncbi:MULTISPECIES: hypothetical protein [unclassified Cryobacterium]|uniref:hypothetical protein n=1 Tax=unclassified Cryobacterium TaxID=2649013 RepID=UPI00106B2341|nr:MULTISPECIES: hypothetical protein [unclassified Cryobacterium]MDY7527779.1 hypothetical protein [Cryobacterium sp. 10C2]MDY7556450.1 hypothetical protein [Cryobacterium sp. 10C3]MEB0001719.1 hypothetical protein [Cryobacterium sp. RTC2.1]MEB0200192.1 hypothetical protein [Cryobacterium sp. 5I3]MEB0285094.1 hypothetical protein [Cryobacterium sp. 10S3]